ncbi:MAG: DCC1-like thiol-disulfide oxidoreductase family protein [Bacteroidota bacterium]
MILENKHIILFDGVCNLCNTTIQYVIKYDTYDRFRFAHLQSDVGKKLLGNNKVDTTKTDSIVLINKGGVYLKSTAALKIASQLGFPRNILAIFLIVPAFIRHRIYDFVANNRYKWYGKQESCMMPTPELKKKFLS